MLFRLCWPKMESKITAAAAAAATITQERDGNTNNNRTSEFGYSFGISGRIWYCAPFANWPVNVESFIVPSSAHTHARTHAQVGRERAKNIQSLGENPRGIVTNMTTITTKHRWMWRVHHHIGLCVHLLLLISNAATVKIIPVAVVMSLHYVHTTITLTEYERYSAKNLWIAENET